MPAIPRQAWESFWRAALALAMCAPVLARAWPDKPLRFVVPYAPGGVIDTAARILQPGLGEVLGQPIVIENRSGASGNIGAEAVARAPKDGQTFLVANEAIAINPLIFRSTPFDLYKDFTPVGKLADFPSVMVVHPTVPANSVGEFVALARSKPGQLSFGSAGVGTTSHLAGELLQSMTGIELTHVPYKGGAPAMNDLLAGNIQSMFLSVLLTAPQARTGKLKPLAVLGRARVQQLPQVPTIAEAGFAEIQVMVFAALLAPQGIPQAAVQGMNAATWKVLRSGDTARKLAELGGIPAPSTPAELTEIFRRENQIWSRVIHEHNIHAD